MQYLVVISISFATGMACLILAPAMADERNQAISSLGDFTSQVDVGDPQLKGTAVYDPERQSYTVSGGGKNMWFDKDEFHFVYKRMKGDFILQARGEFWEQV